MLVPLPPQATIAHIGKMQCVVRGKRPATIRAGGNLQDVRGLGKLTLSTKCSSRYLERLPRLPR